MGYSSVRPILSASSSRAILNRFVFELSLTRQRRSKSSKYSPSRTTVSFFLSSSVYLGACDSISCFSRSLVVMLFSFCSNFIGILQLEFLFVQLHPSICLSASKKNQKSVKFWLRIEGVSRTRKVPPYALEERFRHFGLGVPFCAVSRS